VAKVTCAGCGATATDTLDSKSFPPCPKCGSTSRHAAIELEDKVEVHDRLDGKSKRPTAKDPDVEVRTGDDPYVAKGTWAEKERRVDRPGDWYDEVVKDKETGEVLHECHEPLSKHVGRGSAKPKK
jgi:predicted  nucleic acid-binding Zn-ribbon protein